MGIYDSIAIVELPDDIKVASIILGTGKKGYIKTISLKAFTEALTGKIVTQIS